MIRAPLALALALAGGLGAEEAGVVRRSPHGTGDGFIPAPEPHKTRTLRALAGNVLHAVIRVPSGPNADAIALGVTATGFATTLDAQTIDQVSQPGDDSAQALELGAGPLVAGALTLGAYLGGRWGDDPRFAAASYDAVEATLANAIWTGALKHAVGRERPNGEDNLSFPSGHASNAFALATVFERHYGWKAAPGYLLAAWIGFSRLQRDKHHLTDVVAGAALGHIVGRTVVRTNGGRVEPAVRISFHPLLKRGSRGAAVTLRF